MQYVLIHPTTTLLIISYQQNKVIRAGFKSISQNKDKLKKATVEIRLKEWQNLIDSCNIFVIQMSKKQHNHTKSKRDGEEIKSLLNNSEA